MRQRESNRRNGLIQLIHLLMEERLNRIMAKAWRKMGGCSGGCAGLLIGVTALLGGLSAGPVGGVIGGGLAGIVLGAVCGLMSGTLVAGIKSSLLFATIGGMIGGAVGSVGEVIHLSALSLLLFWITIPLALSVVGSLVGARRAGKPLE